VLLRWIKVSGNSMSPAYRDGDYVLVSVLPLWLRGAHPGDVVVFQHPLHGKMIKQVDHLDADGQSVFVVGLHPESSDSRAFGAVPRRMLQGKVILHIAQK
jgi:nickel-type superoxide dismutase maturation protease